jgi:hypothetical protein
MEPAPKVCPGCGEEYLHTVTACVDCGIELSAEGEASAQPAELPPSSELVRVRVESPAWITRLAESLADHGIPSRVEGPAAPGPSAPRQGAPCSLFVRLQDAERAAAIDAELLRAQLPDLPEGAELGWSDTDTCPACGTAFEPEAAECSDCGLVFDPTRDE